MADETELKRLYWHSRRGMLELDVLLVPFVQEVYPGLDAEDQARFRKLLECEDQDMFGWFMQRGVGPAGVAAGLAEAAACAGLPGLRCLGAVPPGTAARLAGLPRLAP